MIVFCLSPVRSMSAFQLVASLKSIRTKMVETLQTLSKDLITLGESVPAGDERKTLVDRCVIKEVPEVSLATLCNTLTDEAR